MSNHIEWAHIGTGIRVLSAANINAELGPEDPMEVGEIALTADGVLIYGKADTVVEKLRAALAEAERHAAAEASRPAEITLTLSVRNIYDDDTITTTKTATVPYPPFAEDGSDEAEEWGNEHIMPLTGTGREEGDAYYEVTVTASNQPDLIPVGQTYEFG